MTKHKNALIVRTPKWHFVYRVDGPSKRAIYVGQTGNEHRRRSAHQREASKCVRLARRIRQLRDSDPDWRFSSNFHRVAGLRHGLPEDESDKYEAFFIARIDGHGTLHHHANEDGCNMREGSNAADHECHFDEIAASLEALGPDQDLFTLEDRTHYLNIGRADVSFVGDLQEAFHEAQLPVPDDVREVYELCVRRCDALANVAETANKIVALKTLTKKTLKNGSCDPSEFAAEWNGLGDLLNEYIADPRNEKQLAMHKLATKTHAYIRTLTQNGETMASNSTSPMVEYPLTLEHMIRLRDEAGGVPTASLRSTLAWCLPDSKLVLAGDNSNAAKLARVEEILHGKLGALTDEQVLRVAERRTMLVAAIATEACA